MATIHASAIVDSNAQLADDVVIGPYAVIGAHVTMGSGCIVGSHSVVEGHTTLGKENRIGHFAAIGGEPQDMKYRGEPTQLIIGDRNTIREFTTIHTGTSQDKGITRIGNDNWIMAYVHLAHDCQVGNHTIFANNASLAGHAEVGDWAILGGFSGAHQFCKIGAHAFVGMGSLVNADVPPFVMVADKYAAPRGINAEGLKRRGFDAERIAAIKRAYRALYMSGKPMAEVREQLAQGANESQDVRLMLEFIERSARGLLR